MTKIEFDRLVANRRKNPLCAGDKVRMSAHCAEHEKYGNQVFTVVTAQEEIGNCPVVWISGYRGAFAACFLEKVEGVL
jgi:hypothetical protein